MNKENSHFLNIANDIISSEFEKRNNQLQNNIDHIADEEAGRAFPIPTGSMIHRINQTYIDELQSRFKFIWEKFLNIIKSHPDEISILTEGINYHFKQQYEFIKKIIENIRDKYELGSPQYESTECSLNELGQEYNRLIKYYKAETQLIESKHTHQATKNKSKLKQLYCYIHSFGKFEGILWYKNATFHFIIAIFLTVTLFLIEPSRKNQFEMIENDHKTHDKLDAIDGKLSQAIEGKHTSFVKSLKSKMPFSSQGMNDKPIDGIVKLVSTLEKLLSDDETIIKSPDYIEDRITGELRKVDISINKVIGSIPVLIIIECKDELVLDDTLWIEQIAQKRDAIKASKAVAVFNNYLSDNAVEKAAYLNIETRLLVDVTLDDISNWFKVQHLTQWLYNVDFLSVSFRTDKGKQEQLDKFIKSNFINKKFNNNEEIFFNTSDNKKYSFDHVWRGVLSKKRKEIYKDVKPGDEKVRRTLFSSFRNPESRYQIITDIGPVDILEIKKICDLWIEEKHIPFTLSQYSSQQNQLFDSVGTKIEANGIEYNFNIHKDTKTGQMYISGNNILDMDFNFVEIKKDELSEGNKKK